MTAGFNVIAGAAAGPVLSSSEALSFWGGVDPATGCVIDRFHPLAGRCISGAILAVPSSRGSCSGSGVLLDLILSGRGPAALVFCEAEDVLTLGALVAQEMFGHSLPILRLDRDGFAAFTACPEAEITATALTAPGLTIPLGASPPAQLQLTAADRALQDGAGGEATRLAMRILCAMARQQGATALIDVSKAHTDGCIYASPANLTFAERMRDLGARVAVPTTMNAISVDRENWRLQGVAPSLGEPSQQLADAYVAMGCRPTFTCAPYLLDAPPEQGEAIGWSESNAVIFANSVLGARTPKHPDFLDLCIALTGRAPLAGVYVEENRRPAAIVDVALPRAPGDAFWPLVGYLAGKAAPDRIPLLRGLASAQPDRDQLKALCAAFGTTSAAPMLHIDGVTPECHLPPLPDAPLSRLGLDDLREAWLALNAGPEQVDLVAIGSPHASLSECRALAEGLADRKTRIPVIVTLGRDVMAAADMDGTAARLRQAGAQLVADLCWCSISEPVFPIAAKTVLTNSGKYAHYGPGLSGRAVRLADLGDCIAAALTGHAAKGLPAWLALE